MPDPLKGLRGQHGCVGSPFKGLGILEDVETTVSKLALHLSPPSPPPPRCSYLSSSAPLQNPADALMQPGAGHCLSETQDQHLGCKSTHRGVSASLQRALGSLRMLLDSSMLK